MTVEPRGAKFLDEQTEADRAWHRGYRRGEREGRAAALREVAEKVAAIPRDSPFADYVDLVNRAAVLAILTEATGASEK
jgi:hypothetical protein